MISAGGPSTREELCICDYHYKKISDDTSGTEAAVWTPASGKSIRVTSGLVSVSAKGIVEVKDSTAEKTIAIFDFNEKKAIPFDIGFELVFPIDHVLSAKFTVDTGTGDAHITFFGLEV